MAPPLSLLLFLALFISATTSNGSGINHPNFSAAFFFGDSTLDTGNNVYVPTVVKGDHSPYGRDFAGHAATGRFSNGLLVPDLLSAELGLKKLLPPFMDPKLSPEDMRTGVNFASAGSGFDNKTSALLNSIPMSRQLGMFRSYLGKLGGMVGEEEASRIVGNALMYISAGTNDFLLNFYDVPKRNKSLNISDYQDFILHLAEGALRDMYNLGGRRFCVVGLAPVGCIPLQITLSFNTSSHRDCINEQNLDSVMYNSKLQKLLSRMQNLLPSSKFVYIDSYDIIMEILHNPAKYGFVETTKGCCGTGLVEVGPFCNFLTPLCKNVSSYVFFDAVHPSERIYKMVADYTMQVIPKLQ